MSKIPAILSATLTISLSACGGGSDHTPIGQPVTAPLVTPEPKTTGTLTVFNSTDGLFITATAAQGWELLETRLAVTTSLDGIPHSKNGHTNIDHFLLRKMGGAGVTELGYNLRLLVEPGTLLYIALHADLRPTTTTQDRHDDGHGDCDDSDGRVSAWALGTPFPSKDGAMYLTYVVRAAPPPSLAGSYVTYTQAGWSSGPGSNPAASTYLGRNFMTAFPQGVTIGTSPGNYVLFTHPQAAAMFLPQSGSPAPLGSWFIDPPDLMNPLAGETLALALNMGFDAFDPTFSSSAVPLASLVVADPGSRFFGLTVGDVLSSANLLLSGRNQDVTVSLADALDAVNRINANFENGTADLGFLSLP